MEIDLNDLKERVKKVLETAVGTANSPVGMAVLEDTHVSLFLIMAVDFLNCQPIAVIDKVKVLPDGDKPIDLNSVTVKLKLPIPQMFDKFWKMRYEQLTSGEPSSGFTVDQKIEIVTENPNAS